MNDRMLGSEKLLPSHSLFRSSPYMYMLHVPALHPASDAVNEHELLPLLPSVAPVHSSVPLSVPLYAFSLTLSVSLSPITAPMVTVCVPLADDGVIEACTMVGGLLSMQNMPPYSLVLPLSFTASVFMTDTLRPLASWLPPALPTWPSME